MVLRSHLLLCREVSFCIKKPSLCTGGWHGIAVTGGLLDLLGRRHKIKCHINLGVRNVLPRSLDCGFVCLKELDGTTVYIYIKFIIVYYR